jgi:hypothetical protein
LVKSYMKNLNARVRLKIHNGWTLNPSKYMMQLSMLLGILMLSVAA